MKRKKPNGLPMAEEEENVGFLLEDTRKTQNGQPIDPQLQQKINGLSKDQKNAFDLVLEGKNVFITGKAGTGKSYLLEVLVDVLPPSSTAITASTGAAASLIGGFTTHFFAGMGLGDESVDVTVKRMKESVKERWMTCKCLVIDEISMISKKMFEKLEGIARVSVNPLSHLQMIRKSNEPFGGIQLVFCGDFFQLPPVGVKEFCFESVEWDRAALIHLELTTVFRQEDEEFIRILNEIRLGNLSESSQKALASRVLPVPDDGILTTTLFPLKESVNKVNNDSLNALPGSLQTFKAIDGGLEPFLSELRRTCPAPLILHLKVNAQVILLRNLNVPMGLVNGARGVVKGFTPEGSPSIQFGKTLTVVTPVKFSINRGHNALATRSQLPLSLSWALSIHKSQGMTIERVQLSLRDVFEEGQAYVALSRVKSLGDLYLSESFDPSLFPPNTKVKTFHSQHFGTVFPAIPKKRDMNLEGIAEKLEETLGDVDSCLATAKEKLKSIFGFDTLKEGQEDVLRSLFEGQSAGAIFPTGGGKSLCFQLPALLFNGLTLVVCPLLAIMKDQVDFLRKKGVQVQLFVRSDLQAERLDSSLSRTEYHRVLTLLREGHICILYISPERFNNERFLRALQRSPQGVSLFVIDEAHCLSEWAVNFRPEYLKLAKIAKSLRARRVLALTATATPPVIEDLKKELSLDTIIATGFYRSNLTLLGRLVPSSQRMDTLKTLLLDPKRPRGSTIVYVTLRKDAEKVALFLEQTLGAQVRCYHAGMKDEERESIHEWFFASEKGVVVSTIAFGMGVDKSDIRYVYHFNLPKNLESYSQEIGRAGRDGKPALCDLLFSPEDIPILESFAVADTPSEKNVHAFLKDILLDEPVDGEEVMGLSVYNLCRQYDIRDTVVSTYLVQLELKNILLELTPYFSTYKFSLTNNCSLYQTIGKSKGTPLELVLRGAETKSKFTYTIDMDSLVLSTSLSRSQIMEALEEAERDGILTFTTEGVRKRYKRLRKITPSECDQLAREFFHNSLVREKREVERVSEMFSLFSARCRYRFLSAYFGRDLGRDCGHCSWCLHKESITVTIPPSTPLSFDTCLPAFRECASKGMRTDPLAIAKFSMGMTSPGLAKLRLFSNNPLFGSLEGHGYAFQDVLRWATKFVSELPPWKQYEASELSSKILDTLKILAQERGLPISGKKAELIARILKFQDSMNKH